MDAQARYWAASLFKPQQIDDVRFRILSGTELIWQSRPQNLLMQIIPDTAERCQ